MLKELLLTIILFLPLENAMAESSPPALPDPTLLSIEADLKQEIEENNKSWWDKTKDFFGFSEAKKVEIPPLEQVAAPEVAPASAAISENTASQAAVLQTQEQTTSPDNATSITEIPSATVAPLESSSTTSLNKEAEAEVKQEEIKEILSEFSDNKQNATNQPQSVENNNVATEVAPAPAPVIKESDLPDIPLLSSTPQNTEVTTEPKMPEVSPNASANNEPELSSNTTTVPQENTPEDPMSSGISVTSKDRIEKYKQQIQEKLKEAQPLPAISDDELNLAIKTDDSVLGQQLDDKQFKFVTDETKMLLLPEDDVVLGKLTDEAILSTMDVRSYLELFWKNYAQLRDEEKRRNIDEFIQHYETNYNSETVSYHDNLEILNAAFNAINKGLDEELKVLLDHYNILQLSDSKGNNMLHFAAAQDNYSAAKILLMRGIKHDATNQKMDTPIMIAKRYNKEHVKLLLQTASGF